MVELYVCNNVVFLSKGQEHYQDFVKEFLVKYEDVTRLDFYNSTKTKKRFKTVKERRNLYTEDDNFVKFSRGILEVIPPCFYTVTSRKDYFGLVTPDIDDDEIRKTLPTFDLRDDQVLAVKKALLCKRGVIQLPTAVGKSAIITSVIKKLSEYNPGKLKALVLAPTLITVKGINKTLEINGVNTKIYGHPDKSISSEVTTSLVQSLVSQSGENPDLLHGINAVFYDECLPSNSKILLPDGSQVSISKIYEDDSINEVLSYSPDTDEYVTRKILRKFRTPYNDRFWKVYYTDPVDFKVKGVSLTPNHKVWTKEKGYLAANELTQDLHIKVDVPSVRNFQALQKLTYVVVKGVSPNIGRKAEYKYNLEIEDTHNYFANNVLVSNCHHLKCDTWNQLNTMLPNVEYSLGFSALSIDKNEIFINDIRDLSYTSSLIVGSSGRVLMHMDPAYYIEKGIIALPVVLRINHKDSLPKDTDESKWTDVVKLGLQSTSRTDKIAHVATIFSKYKRKVLILVSERDHSFVIGRFIRQRGSTRFGISFGAGVGYVCDPSGDCTYEDVTYRKEDTLKVIDMLGSGDIDIVIATSHTDEGVDISSLDACILAGGGKKDRRVIQRVGRVLRKSKTGKYAYVVDFTDSGSRVLSRQSNQRLDMYKKDIGVPLDNIYDGINIEYVEDKIKELEGL